MWVHHADRGHAAGTIRRGECVSNPGVSDIAVVLALALSLATLVTAHAATVYGLLLRPPRWRALAALIAPPLGVYWAWREGMRVRSVAPAVAVVVYVVARLLARS